VRKFIVAIWLLAALVVTAYLLTPPRLINAAVSPALPGDLDAYLLDREGEVAAQFPLVPGTEKRIRWQTAGERTDYALVYLHGFSGTRQGLLPATERIADALGANLFETRLRGHGRMKNGLVDIRAEDWLEDAAEALAIGARIGERVILMGTSTGATLAVAMAGHPAMDQVDAIVLISPNFRPHDPRSTWLTAPGGPLLLRLLVGATHSWEPANAAQARYWTTTYPADSVVEVMRLVDLANARLPLALGQPVLTLYSTRDEVVSPSATEEALQRIDSPNMRTIDLGEVGDRKNHVLAGDILSPDSTDKVVQFVVDFIRDARGAN
jgi:alpha-beta hydrolase superfamily lysophospholipase